MAEIDVLSPAEQSLQLNEGSSVPIIEQQRLSTGLQSFAAACVTGLTEVVDKKINRDHVAAELTGVLEALMPGWERQIEEFVERVNIACHRIPPAGTSPFCVIRLFPVTNWQMVTSLPQPGEACVFDMFESGEGLELIHVLPKAETLPDFAQMAIKAGIAVLIQPVPPMFNQFQDIRGRGMGAGADIYGFRAQDLTETGDQPAEPPFITPQAPLVGAQPHPFVPRPPLELEEQFVGGSRAEDSQGLPPANHAVAHAAEAALIAAELAAEHRRREVRREQAAELAREQEARMQSAERQNEVRVEQRQEQAGSASGEGIAVLAAEAVLAHSEVTGQSEKSPDALGSEALQPERPAGAEISAPADAREGEAQNTVAGIGESGTVAAGIGKRENVDAGLARGENEGVRPGEEADSGARLGDGVSESVGGTAGGTPGAEANPERVQGLSGQEAFERVGEPDGAGVEGSETVSGGSEAATPGPAAETAEPVASASQGTTGGETPEEAEEPSEGRDREEQREGPGTLSTGPSGTPRVEGPERESALQSGPEPDPVAEASEQIDRLKEQLGEPESPSGAQRDFGVESEGAERGAVRTLELGAEGELVAHASSHLAAAHAGISHAVGVSHAAGVSHGAAVHDAAAHAALHSASGAHGSATHDPSASAAGAIEGGHAAHHLAGSGTHEPAAHTDMTNSTLSGHAPSALSHHNSPIHNVEAAPTHLSAADAAEHIHHLHEQLGSGSQSAPGVLHHSDAAAIESQRDLPSHARNYHLMDTPPAAGLGAPGTAPKTIALHHAAAAAAAPPATSLASPAPHGAAVAGVGATAPARFTGIRAGLLPAVLALAGAGKKKLSEAARKVGRVKMTSPKKMVKDGSNATKSSRAKEWDRQRQKVKEKKLASPQNQPTQTAAKPAMPTDDLTPSP